MPAFWCDGKSSFCIVEFGDEFGKTGPKAGSEEDTVWHSQSQLQRDVVRIQKQWTDNIHTVPLLSLHCFFQFSAAVFFVHMSSENFTAQMEKQSSASRLNPDMWEPAMRRAACWDSRRHMLFVLDGRPCSANKHCFSLTPNQYKRQYKPNFSISKQGFEGSLWERERGSCPRKFPYIYIVALILLAKGCSKFQPFSSYSILEDFNFISRYLLPVSLWDCDGVSMSTVHCKNECTTAPIQSGTVRRISRSFRSEETPAPLSAGSDQRDLNPHCRPGCSVLVVRGITGGATCRPKRAMAPPCWLETPLNCWLKLINMHIK
jgi:hypothetical protein